LGPYFPWEWATERSPSLSRIFSAFEMVVSLLMPTISMIRPGIPESTGPGSRRGRGGKSRGPAEETRENHAVIPPSDKENAGV